MARKHQVHISITWLLQFIHLCTKTSAATFSQNIRNILKSHDFSKTEATVKKSIHLNTLVNVKNSFCQKTCLQFRDDPFGLGIDIDEDLGYKNEAMESLGLSMSGRMNIDDLLQSAMDSLKKPKEIVELDGFTRTSTLKSDLFFADYVIEMDESIKLQKKVSKHYIAKDKVTVETQQERKSRIAAREIEIQKKLLQDKVKSILAEQERNAKALAEAKKMEEAKKLQDSAREEERRRIEKMKQEMELVAAEREKERSKELEKLKRIAKSNGEDKNVVADAEKEIKEILAVAKKEDRLIADAAREIKDRLASTISPDEAKLDRRRRMSAQKREFEQFFPLKQKKTTINQRLKKIKANETVVDTKAEDEQISVERADMLTVDIKSEEKVKPSESNRNDNGDVPKEREHKKLSSSNTKRVPVAVDIKSEERGKPSESNRNDNGDVPKEREHEKLSSSNTKRVPVAPVPLQIQKDETRMGIKKLVSKNVLSSTSSKPFQQDNSEEKKSVDALLDKVTAMEKDMGKPLQQDNNGKKKAMDALLDKVTAMEKDMEKEIEAFISRASKSISSEFARVVNDQLFSLPKVETYQNSVVEKSSKPAAVDKNKKDAESSTKPTFLSSSTDSKSEGRKSRDGVSFNANQAGKLQLKAEEEKLQRQIEAMKQKKKLKDEELFARAKVLEAKRKRQAEQQKAIALALAQEEADAIANAKKEAEQEASQIAKRRAIDMEAAAQARIQAREAEEKLRSRSSLTLTTRTSQTDPFQETAENRNILSEWWSSIARNIIQNRESNSRIRIAYDNWCKEYGKISDESRFRIFSSNFLELEEKSKTFGTPFYLNEYADCTEEQYLSLLRVANSEVDSTLQGEAAKITTKSISNNDATNTNVKVIEKVDIEEKEEGVKVEHEVVQTIKAVTVQDEQAEGLAEMVPTSDAVDKTVTVDVEIPPAILPDVVVKREHVDIVPLTFTDLTAHEHVTKNHVVSSASTRLFSSSTNRESKSGKINLHKISTLPSSIDNGTSMRQYEILRQAKRSATMASLTLLAHFVSCTHKNKLYIKELNDAYEIKKDILVAKYKNSKVSSNRVLATLLSMGLLDVHRKPGALPDQEAMVRSFNAISSSMALLILLSVFEAGAYLKIGERLALYSILRNDRLPNMKSSNKRTRSADESILFSSRSKENKKLEDLIDEFILD